MINTFVTILISIQLSDVNPFYLRAFAHKSSDQAPDTIEASMNVYMKDGPFYICLDGEERLKEDSVIGRNFIAIADNELIGLILNLNCQERRQFFHSGQLAPELTYGDEIKDILKEDAEVMVEIENELHEAKIKEIETRMVVVETEVSFHSSMTYIGPYVFLSI